MKNLYGKAIIQCMYLFDRARQPWRWRQHGLWNVGFQAHNTRRKYPENFDFIY